MQTTVVMWQPHDWPAIRQEWAELLQRQEQEQTSFLRNLLMSGTNQQEISKELGLTRPYLSRLIAYESTRQKLVPNGTKSKLPTEGELRPYIDAAAEEVAAERGVERVRTNRDEVYERAARAYERGEKSEKHEPEPEGITCPNCGHWLGATWIER